MHTLNSYFLNREHKIKYVKFLLHAGSNVNMVNSANYNILGVLYRRYPLLFREWGKNSSHPGQRHQETCLLRGVSAPGGSAPKGGVCFNFYCYQSAISKAVLIIRENK